METTEELTKIYLISRNSKTFERGFINRLTNKCISCMLYFPKFDAVKVSFPKCLKCFASFCEVEIVRKHFHFQKRSKFHRLAKSFVNVFKFQKWNVLQWCLLFLINGISKVDYFHDTTFPNLFAVTTCHMKTRPYIVNCKQTDIRMWYLTNSSLQCCVIP